MTGFQGITEAVVGIVQAVDQGFSLSEEGGQPLLEAIQELQNEVRSALQNSQFLEAEPALGTTPNAKIYKPFLATIATDPSQGAIPVLRQLQTDLAKAEQAIKQAMANYVEADVRAGTNIAGSGLGA
ncbi:MAG TPA: hypothetical protein VFW65_18625 [Pseudonocardiaceae bacterium]|nr:hypothetical protein [Pseudonocardiaceae bacterium]